MSPMCKLSVHAGCAFLHPQVGLEGNRNGAEAEREREIGEQELWD